MDPADGFAEEIAHFADTIRGLTEQSCTVEDAVRAVEIVAAAGAD